MNSTAWRHFSEIKDAGRCSLLADRDTISKDRPRGFPFARRVLFQRSKDRRFPSPPTQIGPSHSRSRLAIRSALTVFHSAELRECGKSMGFLREGTSEIELRVLGRRDFGRSRCFGTRIKYTGCSRLSAQLRIAASRSIYHSRVDSLSPKHTSIRQFFSISKEIALSLSNQN